MATPEINIKQRLKQLTPVARVYEQRFDQCGESAKGVFWKNRDSQFRRFEILSAIFDEADQAGGLTIHDFGCGYGALFDFLKDQPVMRSSRYIGTDISEAMVLAARSRIDDPRAEFIHHICALDVADYTLVSGTFNLHAGHDDEAWTEHVKQGLMQLWSKTRKGLAFNLLRKDAPERFAGLYYADGRTMFEFLTARLSPDVTMTNDAPLPDWSFFVRRPRR